MSDTALEPIQIPKELQELERDDHQLALGISYRLQGNTWRRCAELAGYSRHEPLYHAAKPWLALLSQEPKFKAFADLALDNALESAALLNDKIHEPGYLDDLKPVALATFAAINSDKATSAYGLQLKAQALKNDNTGLGAAAKLMQMLHQSGGGKLEVNAEANDGTTIQASIEVSQAPALDVEATEQD